MSPSQNRPPFWRWSVSQNAILFSTYHLSEDNLPSYVRALARLQPHYVEGYPSVLHLVALALLKSDLSVRPRAVITSSETLLPPHREAIEAAFQCPVFDQYGAVEMCVFAAQCREGRYHLRPDYGVLEVLRDGKPVAPGEEGEAVCTGFINRAMPLIRYPIGDMVVLDEGPPCDCGVDTPLIRRVIGRVEDLIVTPEGRHVGSLGLALEGLPIREAQFLQETPASLMVRLVPAEEFTTGHQAVLESQLRMLVGSGLRLNFALVEGIPRGPGGKFRPIVSLIPNGLTDRDPPP